MLQTDLEDQSNELRNAEDQAKKAMADAARLADELRQEQDHAGQIERMRRSLENQVRFCFLRVCLHFAAGSTTGSTTGRTTGWTKGFEYSYNK